MLMQSIAKYSLHWFYVNLFFCIVLIAQILCDFTQNNRTMNKHNFLSDSDVRSADYLSDMSKVYVST